MNFRRNIGLFSIFLLGVVGLLSSSAHAKGKKGWPIKPADRPLIHRTATIDGINCGPRSVAVGFPQNLSYCFDTEACMVTAIWSDGFLDVKPEWTGRGGSGTFMEGNVFYEAANKTPLLFSGVDNKKRKFISYRMKKDIPTFNYEIDGKVKVQLTAMPNKDGSGLLVRYEIEGAQGPIKFQAKDASKIKSASGKFENNLLTVSAADGKTVIELEVLK